MSKWTWFLGWSEYRAKRCAEARRVLSKIKGSGNTLVGPKALYWQARCFRQEGKHTAADRVLDSATRRAPLSYYGLHSFALGGESPNRLLPRQVVKTDYGLR